ncbi:MULTISPECIES: SusC/RagA family TonB-linked outer membrane protein [Flavobacterium]|uniref:SusC/RagA family TonB-linked outer membrane protein n=1 Tax=Flavobacterium jumunjinense TaxID=998845 RepID=A0ABV5GP61_9FLAO|nr:MULTISPECIES: SusC/RagA family TonB-linked outer membrane protein [Flavobacterium]
MKKLFFLMTIILSYASHAQETRTITGQVIDSEDRLPIPGVSVYVEKQSISNETEQSGIIQSTSVGTITDMDGYFKLEINKEVKSLRVSFMGYQSYLIDLSSQNNYNIALKVDLNELQEIVVTGYQKIEKRKLTSALTKVDMEDIQQAGVASVDQLLAGQVAGVAITPGNGAPGGAAKIRIRGTASLSGPQDPLWVLDGLPLEGNDVPNFNDKDNIDQLNNFSIAGLNPDDIKDITILKDAAATAIYGARAANGVIVITTKKGRKGKMSVNFTANTFVTQKPDFSKLNLMNANQKVDFELALAGRSDLTFRDDKGEISRILNGSGELDAYRTGGFSALTPGTQQAINTLRNNQTDWGNLLYRTAVNKQYGLSLSGGGEKSDYYFSLGYYDEKGTTIGTGFERYNITLKNNYELSDRFKVGIGLFGSQSKNSSYISDSDAFTNPANYSRNANPYLSPKDENGNYIYDQDIQGYSDRYVPFNFLEERENTSYELKTRAIKAIFDLEYKVIKDLKLTSQIGLQMDNSGTEKYAGKETYFSRKEKEKTRRYSNGSYYYFLPEGGIIQNWNTDFFQYNIKTQLMYNKIINEKHELDFLIGNELRRNYNTNIYSRGFGYDRQTGTTSQIVFPNQEIANSNEYRTYNRTKNENAFASMYATASYTYNRKYTVFGSVRYDGSDLFGVDPKYKYLPLWSISGSWFASEEDFIKNNIKAISNLRFRASYGLQGNIDKGTSPFVVGNYGTANILPGQSETTIVVTSPPNNKLRWEKTENVNFGLDLGVLKNRINVAADLYGRRSTDLLGIRALPLENGFEYTNMNWAQVTNKGYEISVSTKNIDNPNFKWSTNFNFAHNKSNIDRIEVRANSYLPSGEGYPVNAVFALKTAGIDENGYPQFLNNNGEVVNAVDFFQLYDPYAVIFPGEISQSRLTENAENFRSLFTYVGDRDPKFTGGFINTFKIKNFDVTISTTFNLKQTVVKTPPYNGTQVDRGQNYTTDILDAWSPSNPNSNLPGIVGANSGTGDSWMAYQWFANGSPVNTYALLDTWVDEMSYMRLSSIRLGYTLPKSVTDKMKIQNVRFNVEGRNLFVVSSNYKGYFDPETYGNIYAQPIPRSITLGLNLTF